MVKNNPLLDNQFLHELDHYRNRVTFARITSLTLDLYPIEQIEGVVTDGSVTVDGSSAVRRVCSLTMTTKNVNLNNVYWGVTTRVRIELGLARNFEESLDLISSVEIVENYKEFIEKYEELGKKYENYPDIIWFPLGVFILQDFKTSQQVNNYTITLTGKDKMCLLNGDIGGVFNAETDLGQEEIEQDDGGFVKIQRSIPYIIREMVHHYAQEPFHNIIIKDINELALEILRNNAEQDIYLIKNKDTDEYYSVIDSTQNVEQQDYVEKDHPLRHINFSNLPDDFNFTMGVDEDNSSLQDAPQERQPTIIIKQIKDKNNKITKNIECVVVKVSPGEDIGYQIRELTYPEDLIAGIGETVTSILDKIVKQFGAYEYFYNLDGQFVFQAKKTYVNTHWDNRKYYDNQSYIEPAAVATMTVYNFEGSQLTTAYQNTPNVGKIKNDYTVWGKKKNSSGQEYPIHMRYAIDKKPFFYRSYDNTIYVTEEMYEEALEGTANTGSEYRREMPAFIPAGNSWWHIVDWQNYYKDVTETYPSGRMREYQAATNKGYAKKLYFPGGPSNYDLVIEFSNRPAKEEDYEPYHFYIGTQPCFIFDVYTTGNFKGYPVGWKGWANSECTIPNAGYSTGSRQGYLSGFQHRFNGCGHTYADFVTWAEVYRYDSYVFEPTIVDKASVVHEDKLINDSIITCDWREIIYQMARDYYLHNHEDDFYYTIRLHNYLPGSDIALYQNGHTGYEQYYHDIEGFWRLLYLPEWAVADKQSYFDQFRKITATSTEDNNAVTFALKKKSNSTTYELVNEEDESVYQYDLQQLIEADYQVAEKEDDLKDAQEEFDNMLELKNTYINSTKMQTASNIYKKFIEDINKQKEIYYSIMDGTYDPNKINTTADIQAIYRQNLNQINNDITLTEEQKQTRINELNAWLEAEMGNNYELSKEDLLRNFETTVTNIFNQYKENLSSQGCFKPSQQSTYEGYIGNALQKFKDIIQLSYEIEEDIINIMPGYTNIKYSCQNEEDFYKKVAITQRGFPVLARYLDLDEETYSGWNKNIYDDPSNLIFWFDFFDADSLGIGQFSVPAIGDRPKVINNDAVRAIIYKDVPDVVFIKGSDYLKYEEDLQFLGDYTYMKITDSEDNSTSFIYDLMQEEIPKIVRSTRGLTAQEQIDDLLYNFGYCNENITITSVPIYYLEPNTIISAKDEQRVVNGYYILNKMTIPLKYNGTMQINAIRVPERVY